MTIINCIEGPTLLAILKQEEKDNERATQKLIKKLHKEDKMQHKKGKYNRHLHSLVILIYGL